MRQPKLLIYRLEKIVRTIEVKDLSFAYPGSDKLILENLEMKVNEGDFVCLLGQSGCGKSTFLRLLAGLEVPKTGCIEVFGEKVTSTSLERSVVFQDYGLFPWMSAGDNIVLALEGKFPNLSKAERKEMALRAIESVQLDREVFDKLPKELSGGMQQRCAIARSFALDSETLLMDEPFGALDAVTRAKLQDLVLNLWSKQEVRKTVFFVTHDVEEALLLATRIFVFGQSPSHIIYEKEIQRNKIGDREELYEREDIRELRTTLVEQINQDVVTHVGD